MLSEVEPEVAQALCDSGNVENIAFTEDEVTITVATNRGNSVDVVVNANAEGDGVVMTVTRAN